MLTVVVVVAVYDLHNLLLHAIAASILPVIIKLKLTVHIMCSLITAPLRRWSAEARVRPTRCSCERAIY